MIVPRVVCITALDGYSLKGTLFLEESTASADRVAVFNAGAGISASYYRPFAIYLAEQGIPTLTYDYRGVGGSRPPKLRGFRASIEDWSEFDCGGAIRWLRENYPRAELTGIAHSVGTLLLGGAPNSSELRNLIMICPHTGYYGDYHPKLRIPMAMLWHGIMPAVSRVVGYFPARAFGLGEDLPLGIALQWAARRTPELAPHGHTRARAALDKCRALTADALVISFADDAFATESGTMRLLRLYPNLRTTYVRLSPPDLGAKHIGHFGFFRPEGRSGLWPRILAYILRDHRARVHSSPVAAF